MKKHSPNFFENLQEADTAKNNRATTFFWTVVFVITLMLGLSVTKTKAQYTAGHYAIKDTIAVYMIVTDTTSTWNYLLPYGVQGKQVSAAKGYEVTESYTHGAEKQHYTDPFSICVGCTKYKTTYLNHKKQPLPDGLIVWMAVRRKER